MSRKSFEESLRKKSDEYVGIPRKGMWEKVESGLPPERKRNRAVFLWFLSGVLGLMTIILLVFTLKIPDLMHQKEKTVSGLQTEVLDQRKMPLTVKSGTSPLKNKMHEIEVKQEANPQLIKNHGKRGFFSKNKNSYQILGAPEESKNQNLTENSDPEKMAGIPDKIMIPSDPSEETIPETMKEFNPVINPLLAINDSLSVTDSNSLQKEKNLSSQSKFFAGILILPSLSQSRITVENGYRGKEPYQSYSEQRKQEAKGAYQFSAGIFAGIERNHQRLGIGLHYQELAYRLPVRNINSAILKGSITTMAKFDYSATDSFMLQKPSEGGYYISNRFKFISVPITYGRSILSGKKFGLYIMGSASYNLLLSYKGLISEENSGFLVKQERAQENRIQKGHFAAAAGIELQYRIKPFCSILLRPQYQLSLSPLEGGIVRTGYQLWSAGAGILFYLK